MAGYLAGDVDEWIYIDIKDQHPDSIRFIRDCEAAIGQKIQRNTAVLMIVSELLVVFVL